MANHAQIDPPYAALEKAGTFGLRYGLVLIFLWIGALKFTAYEAEGITTFVMNSPFFSWAYGIGKEVREPLCVLTSPRQCSLS